jgi:hypothetical protein
MELDYEPDYFTEEGTVQYEGPDPAVIVAESELRRFFARRKMPFYLGQLECMFEKKYYHWVTYNAVQRLLADKFLVQYKRTMKNGNRVYFVARPHDEQRIVEGHITSIVDFLERVWIPELSTIRGKHLAALVKAELRAHGFTIVKENSNSYRGRTWPVTEHNLDFIAELSNGKGIGVEVKNTVHYIPREEMLTKLDICDYLGIQALFAVRWMPKSYIYEDVFPRKGFCWLFEYQAYPLGYEELCRQIVTRLKFPAMVMTEIPPRARQIFADYFVKPLQNG